MTIANQFNKTPYHLEFADVLCKCCNKESIMYIELMEQMLFDKQGRSVFIYNCPYCDFVFVGAW